MGSFYNAFLKGAIVGSVAGLFAFPLIGIIGGACIGGLVAISMAGVYKSVKHLAQAQSQGSQIQFPNREESPEKGFSVDFTKGEMKSHENPIKDSVNKEQQEKHSSQGNIVIATKEMDLKDQETLKKVSKDLQKQVNEPNHKEDTFSHQEEMDSNINKGNSERGRS